MAEVLRVGPAKYFKSGVIKFAEYAENNIAILIVDEFSEERLAVASVNLDELPPKGHVWLKGWSENEGIPEALEKAGIVELTGETTPTGYVEAQLAKLLKGPSND